MAMRTAYPPEVYRVFLAEHDGHPVAGQQCLVYNNIVCLIGVSYSDYARRHKIPGNDLMQWHLIEWAHNEGYEVMDWRGYALNPHDEKQRGINHFKAKWGGDIVSFHTYSKIYSPWRYNLFQRLKSRWRQA